MASTTTLRIFDGLSEDVRKSLTRTFGERHDELERSGRQMYETLSRARDRGWETHASVWNSCLFLNIACYDLSVLTYDLVYEREEWRRRLRARSLALVLYEVAEDLPAVFGKSFRMATEALCVPSELMDALNGQMKRVSTFRRKHRSMLAETRVVAAAHRDHDAARLLDTIDRLDLLGVLQSGLDLGMLVCDLGCAAAQILSFASSVERPELAKQASHQA